MYRKAAVQESCSAGKLQCRFSMLTPAQCAAQAGYQLPANCCCDTQDLTPALGCNTCALVGCSTAECNPGSVLGCNVCTRCCNSSIPTGGGSRCDSCVREHCCIPPAAVAAAAAAPPVVTTAHSAMRHRQQWLDGGSTAAPMDHKLPSSAEGARSFAAMADAKPVWTFDGGAPIPLSPAINAPGSLVFAAVESTGVVGFGGRPATIVALNASSSALVWSFFRKLSEDSQSLMWSILTAIY